MKTVLTTKSFQFVHVILIPESSYINAYRRNIYLLMILFFSLFARLALRSANASENRGIF